jgi:hypothetical protein
MSWLVKDAFKVIYLKNSPGLVNHYSIEEIRLIELSAVARG